MQIFYISSKIWLMICEVIFLFKKNKKALYDFKRNQLPQNRVALVLDIIKMRWIVLLKLGIILLFFGIPIIIFQILLNINLYEINLSYSLGHIDQEYAMKATFDAVMIGNLILIVLLCIFGISLSGVLKSIRHLIWQDPVFIGHDFKAGIKSHIYAVSMSFLIIGIANFIFQYVLLGSSFREETLLQTIALVFSIVLLITSLIVALFVIMQSTLYNLSFTHIYKNALLMTMHYFFSSLIVMVINLAPWLLLRLPLESYFIFLFSFLFMLVPINLLVLMSYAYHIFDDLINKANYPNIYRKGLYSDDAKN